MNIAGLNGEKPLLSKKEQSIKHLPPFEHTPDNWGLSVELPKD
jgi:hypothetical protein